MYQHYAQPSGKKTTDIKSKQDKDRRKRREKTTDERQKIGKTIKEERQENKKTGKDEKGGRTKDAKERKTRDETKQSKFPRPPILLHTAPRHSPSEAAASDGGRRTPFPDRPSGVPSATASSGCSWPGRARIQQRSVRFQKFSRIFFSVEALDEGSRCQKE